MELELRATTTSGPCSGAERQRQSASQVLSQPKFTDRVVSVSIPVYFSGNTNNSSKGEQNSLKAATGDIKCQ